MTRCSIDGCPRAAHARGWCKLHYENNRIYGNPISLKDRMSEFANAAISSNLTSCIIWPFTKTRYGYGRITVDGKRQLVHRYICEMANGPAPRVRKDAAHDCGNTSCVNPRHLRWSTHAENMADKLIHFRRGSGIPWSRLDEAAVRDVLATRAKTINSLASKYNVNPEVIRKIWMGKNWRWLDDNVG